MVLAGPICLAVVLAIAALGVAGFEQGGPGGAPLPKAPAPDWGVRSTDSPSMARHPTPQLGPSGAAEGRAGDVSRSGIVTSNSSGSVAINASATTSEVNLPVLFRAVIEGSSAPQVYVWKFGDNTTSAEADPSHLYEATGTFTVSLESIWPHHVVATASPVSISIGQLLYVSGSSVPLLGTVGAPVTLSATVVAGVPPYDFFWELGDGSVSHSENTTHPYASPGTYVASLVVNDSLRAQSRFSVTVLVSGPSSVGTPPPPPASGTSPLVWLAVGVAGAALALVAVWWARRRR